MKRPLSSRLFPFALAGLALMICRLVLIVLASPIRDRCHESPCPLRIEVDWHKPIRMGQPVAVTMTVWPKKEIKDVTMGIGNASLGPVDLHINEPIRLDATVYLWWPGCHDIYGEASYAAWDHPASPGWPMSISHWDTVMITGEGVGILNPLPEECIRLQERPAIATQVAFITSYVPMTITMQVHEPIRLHAPLPITMTVWPKIDLEELTIWLSASRIVEGGYSLARWAEEIEEVTFRTLDTFGHQPAPIIEGPDGLQEGQQWTMRATANQPIRLNVVLRLTQEGWYEVSVSTRAKGMLAGASDRHAIQLTAAGGVVDPWTKDTPR